MADRRPEPHDGNGLTGLQSFSGVSGSLFASMKDGADKVQFLGNSTHQLSSIQVSTEGGDDTVSVDKVFAREVKLSTGAGNDTVNVLAITAESVSVETEAGDDTVVVGSTLATRHDVLVKVKEFEIETGAGNDQVSILDAVLQTGEFQVDTGAGEGLGKFWQSRYKAVRILDEETLLACAAYVDLNPIRAALSETLEASDYTSVQRRISSLLANSEPSIDSNESSPSCHRADDFLSPISVDERHDPLGAQPSRHKKRCSDKGFF